MFKPTSKGTYSPCPLRQARPVSQSSPLWKTRLLPDGRSNFQRSRQPLKSCCQLRPTLLPHGSRSSKANWTHANSPVQVVTLPAANDRQPHSHLLQAAFRATAVLQMILLPVHLARVAGALHCRVLARSLACCVLFGFAVVALPWVSALAMRLGGLFGLPPFLAWGSVWRRRLAVRLPLT